MWEVLALEAETLPPELEGIAGDYGHVAESFSLSRRGHPGDRIDLVSGRVAAFTRNGVRYELSPTTEPNVYVLLLNGKTYSVRIYYYCQGPRPTMPPGASDMACAFMPTEKLPCSFSCKTGFELSEPSLLVGSLACTASGKFTANSSCVRVGGAPSPTEAPSAPSSAPRPESDPPSKELKLSSEPPSAPNESSFGERKTGPVETRAWSVVLVLFAIALAVFLFKRRGR
jgi:hypothetical protein